MATFTYTASRNLKTGHTAGTEYTITIGLQQYDGDIPKPVKNEHRSLSGFTVTTLHRIDVELQVLTDYINSDGTGTPDVDDFDEFLASVAGGEVFEFGDGTTTRDVKLIGSPGRRREGTMFYAYSLKMRVT